MSSAEATVSVSRPPDAVWAVAGDFGGLDQWMPAVDSCRLEDDVRVLSVLGMEVSEKLLRRDDAERILEYSIIASPLTRSVILAGSRSTTRVPVVV